MNSPPIASPGAKAIAWTAPSTVPQRSFSSPRSAAMSASELTSSSSTSGTGSSRAAERSVIRFTRPKLVSSTSAPCACARSAIAKAMLWRLTTPVTRIFFPSRITLLPPSISNSMPKCSVQDDRRLFGGEVRWPALDGCSPSAEKVSGSRSAGCPATGRQSTS